MSFALHFWKDTRSVVIAAMEKETETIPLGLYLWKRYVVPGSRVSVEESMYDTRW